MTEREIKSLTKVIELSREKVECTQLTQSSTAALAAASWDRAAYCKHCSVEYYYFMMLY